MNFTILKRATRPADVLISVAIFKMSTTATYRDFGKYETNLYKCINATGAFNIRVYVDATTAYLVDKYAGAEHVEFVLYKVDAEGAWGTLGSTVRFHPCFEWPVGYKYVWVSDIDVPLPSAFAPAYIEDLVASGAVVSYVSFNCYEKPWITVNSPVVNYRFICTEPVASNNIFYDYIRDLAGSSFDAIRAEIIASNMVRKRGGESLHPYGMDEYFTNTILMPFIMKKRVLIDTHITLTTFINNIKYDEKVGQDAGFLALAEEIDKIDYVFYKIVNVSEENIVEYIRLVKQLPTAKKYFTDIIQLLSHPNTVKHIMINLARGKGVEITRLFTPIA